MDLWQWVLAAALWPVAVFFTGMCWGAGSVAGELKYLARGGVQHARSGGKDGDESGT